MGSTGSQHHTGSLGDHTGTQGSTGLSRDLQGSHKAPQSPTVGPVLPRDPLGPSTTWDPWGTILGHRDLQGSHKAPLEAHSWHVFIGDPLGPSTTWDPWGTILGHRGLQGSQGIYRAHTRLPRVPQWALYSHAIHWVPAPCRIPGDPY